MANIRVGITGIGNIGTTHIARFQRGDITGAELAGICDTSPAALARHSEIKGWRNRGHDQLR